MNNLHGWEKWPVGALMGAAGLNTALWYIGSAMPGEARAVLPWLVVLAGLASVIAIDGALIATIAGMREGRAGRWSVANIAVTAVFTGAAALTAHGQLAWLAPWLHGLFAAAIVTYAMHLAQPRRDATIALALREQEVARREQDVTARERATLTPVNATQVNVTIEAQPVDSEGDTGVNHRRAQVRALVDSGATVTSAARQVGVSRQTATKWIKEG